MGHTANEHLQKILQPGNLTLHEFLFLRNVHPASGVMGSRCVCAKHLALSRSLNTDPFIIILCIVRYVVWPEIIVRDIVMPPVRPRWEGRHRCA